MPRDSTQPTNVTWADDFAAIQVSKIDNSTVWGVRTDILLGLGGSPNYLNTAHAPDLIHPDNSGDVLLAEGNDTTRGFNNTITQVFNSLPCVSSDTPCGDNNLLTKNSIAITKNGEFLFKT